MRGASHRLDEGLPLLQRPLSAGSHRWPDPELAVAVAASSLPVRLDGAKATVLGTVRGPLDEVRFGATRAVVDIVWGHGPVANAVVSPGLLRRERVGSSGSSEEVVLVAPGLPLVAIVTRKEGSGPTSLELTALPDAGDIRYRIGSGGVTLCGGPSDELLALAADPASTWSVEPAPSGGARLRCSDEAGIESLVMAYGSEAAVRTALNGSGHLTGHAVRAGARPDPDLLGLDTGAYGLDQAIAWMVRRLGAGIDTALERSSPTGGDVGAEAWLWAALGAVAIGDLERARRCASALDRLGRADAAAFVPARATLSDGRTDGLMEAVERSLTATDVEDPTLRRLGLRAAADALRYAATEGDIRRLAAAGREPGRPREESSAVHRGVRLPTLGGGPVSATRGSPPPVTVGTWLTRMLEGSPEDRPGSAPPSSAGPPPVTRALEAWAAMASSSAGWSAWRAMVSEGLDSGAWGVGCWDPVDPGTPPAATGALLSGMGFGWLGAFPDAPVGRLTVKPRIPERLRSFRFAGIAIGDVRVDMAYERSGARHRFDLDPRRGRVPPLVVFETTIPGEAARVTIDGAPAELDATPSGAGVTVRLQTPLDVPRRIEIEAATTAG